MEKISHNSDSATGYVWVEAPARLHMGFIDLNGGLGRRFGSLGMTLEGMGIRLCAVTSRSIQATGPGGARAAECARRLAQAWRLPGGVHLDIEQGIPEHVGLGSGTQLSLAVGAALASLYDVGTDARDIACYTERGARSGIGIGAFQDGGFLVDGGRSPDSHAPPPLISRMDVPASWWVLLVLDRRGQGLHGNSESAAFEALPPFPDALAAHLSRVVLMQVLPALAEADLDGFGAGVSEIQARVGDYFAPAQGGCFTSPEVADAIHWLSEEGAVGLGQSSWGPTGFCLVDGEARAHALIDDARRHFSGNDSLEFLALSARNTGSRVWHYESAVVRHARSTA
ncbi:MAG: GHMP kinase [Gammaproteobacteria bacterium]|jgi:beta-ribofuranosylaminobenzene 5'-phosphate synthase